MQYEAQGTYTVIHGPVNTSAPACLEVMKIIYSPYRNGSNIKKQHRERTRKYSITTEKQEVTMLSLSVD